MLYKKPFNLSILQILFTFSECILRIFLWSLNHLLGLFILTNSRDGPSATQLS